MFFAWHASAHRSLMPQRPPYFDDAPFPFDLEGEASAKPAKGALPAGRAGNAGSAVRAAAAPTASSAPRATLQSRPLSYQAAMRQGYRPAAPWPSGRASATPAGLTRTLRAFETDARPARSEASEPVLTVSAAVTALDNAVRGLFPKLWIGGEVCELTRSPRGHYYFSLKDEKSRVSCVLWAGTARTAGADFEVGSAIEVQCEAQVYGARGSLQMNVRAWRLAGRGALLEAFERLKRKLEAEGLFENEHKQRIPRFVERVAIVTSANAAALQDVLRTTARRTPWIRTKLFDALVQGEEAPAALIAALRRADRSGADVVLLVRGGGSLEDLQAFNDEGLARTIFAMQTPVITGVGHEVDTTIADFVADLRASTPTAAAEQLGEDLSSWLRRLDAAERALGRGLGRTLAEASRRTARAAFGIDSAIARELRNSLERLDRAQASLPSPEAYAQKKAAEMRSAAVGLSRAASVVLDRKREDAARAAEALETSALRELAAAKARLSRTAAFFETPEGFLSAPHARLAAAGNRLARGAAARLGRAVQDLLAAQTALGRQTDALLARSAHSIARAERLQADPEKPLQAARRRLQLVEQLWASADPAKLLARGYARIRTASGYAARLEALRAGEAIVIEMQGGEASATVNALHPQRAEAGEAQDGNNS